MVVGAQQKADATQRVEAQKHRGILEDKEQTRTAQEQKPQRHDGAKGVANLGRADALHQEERDDDGERDGDNAALVVTEHGVDRRNGAQALDSRGNGNGRRQDAVGEERRPTQHGGDDKPLAAALDQAVQGKDAALAVVVGAQRDQHVLDGRQQRDRPHDKGERAEHELLRDASDAAVAGNERLGYIHGLVPISPYTTPSVTSIAEMLTGIAACEATSFAFCSISQFPPNFNVRRDYR